MHKKKNSLPRKEAWKRFHDGIQRLRADIAAGVTTADTYKVEDYFTTHYGRGDLEPLVRSTKQPDERACTMFMYFYNRFKNVPRRKRKTVQVVEQHIDFLEFNEENCIDYLKSRGYRILKPKTEYEEI